MSNVISHVVAGKLLGVSIDKLGTAVMPYEQLVEISNIAYETLINESPDAVVALTSEGSNFLKSALVCQCVVVVFSETQEISKSEQIVTACASTATQYFLSMVEISEEEDSLYQQANLLLISLVNKLIESTNS